MPKSLENYQQESGRAGRDGLEAECCLLYSGNDPRIWRKLTEEDSPESRAATLRSLDAIDAFCTGITCRHQKLVEHFGQDWDRESCNACDVCLGQLDLMEDALVLGQKILSSVVRQQQRFGGEYTAQVLKGSKLKRILDNNHDQLSTFGLLKDHEKQAIRDWIEQLASQGFLAKEGEFNVLKITPAGRKLLKGELKPRLLKPRKEAKKKAAAVETDAWEGVHRELFEALRKLRRDEAERRGISTYIVFSDAALREMARRRPSTLEAFRTIRGVGEKKLEDYGDLFVNCLVKYCGEHRLPMDVRPK
jgi:ATP-dependent DNA helicase RecQ